MLPQFNLKSNKLQTIGYGLIILALAIGLITTIIAVFQYITFDIGPDPDQIKDAFEVMQIWQGKFPILGPRSSIGGHHIPPLYYYLFFPFTLLGANPAFQAFPNALSSFLAILLLMYLIYQLLQKVDLDRRIFLSGLAGLWYSLIYGIIFIVNFQWNPSSVPLFLLLWIWLYQLQMESKDSWQKQAILWACYGVVLAIIISLHSSTLFLMPIVFAISSLLFIVKKFRKQEKLYCLLPGVAVISCIIALFPYWVGEFSRKFANTKAILKTLTSSSSQDNETGLIGNLLTKLSKILFNYFGALGQHTYFVSESWLYLAIAIMFMSLIAYLAITRFKGNQYIWQMLGIIWFLYLLASASLNDVLIHYQLLIVFAPIILSVVSLAYLDYDQIFDRVCIGFIGICIILSCGNNFIYDYRFLMAKYSSNNLMNTSQLTQILDKIPANSTICDPKVKRKREFNNQYNYIDTFITHQNLKIVSDCQSGNFVIHPKRVMLLNGNYLIDSDYQGMTPVRSMPNGLWPIFEVVDNQAITRNHQLFLETDTANVYILE